MAKIVVQTIDGDRRELEATIGDSIMRIALDNGIDGLAAECGGCLSCATCHCYIGQNWMNKLPEPSPEEQVMVECAIDVRPTSRLSCQITMTEELDGLEIEIPQSQY